MPGQTDADIPETGAIFTFGKSSFADNVPSHFWLKNDHPVEICCGREHSAVITENGRLLMFGGNAGGQLGLKIKPAANKPASVKALKPEKVKLVACGRDHTLVCTLQHCVYSAGRNQKGQLGLGHKKNTKSFQLLRPFGQPAPVKMLAAGSSTSAVLTEDGRLFTWGDNSVGQIGLGDQVFAAQPTELNMGQAVMWVSCGDRHSAFVTVHGRLYTFGESANGRLGLQEEQLANHRVPQQVHSIVGCLIQVCCGGEHTVALTGEDVYTFGRGQYGQLGHGTFQFELHLPKALEHLHNSSARRIACGESHTAVITKAGLLYTFGDGRYGKLGLQEENFINRFSPTLCTRFLKYSVQSVSCGGHHTLVLAVPRSAAQSPDVVPEKDAVVTGFFCQEPEDAVKPWKDSLMDPAPVVPLAALAARARHREKTTFVELFGELPQKRLRLNSGLLCTSWQISGSIQNLKLLPEAAHPATSSPKAATASPLLSPRFQSVSSQLSSKPSSPRSRSPYPCQSKASAAAPSRSKPKKLSSPVSSSSSISKGNPSSPAHAKKALNSKACRAAKSENASSDKPSDASPPNTPCSPSRPLIHVTDDNLNQDRPQTEGEATEGKLIAQDVEDEGNRVNFLPYMEKKTARVQISKEPEVHADENSDQSSLTRKEEGLLLKSRREKPRVTSQDHQNINKSKTSQDHQNINKSKTSQDHQNINKSKTKSPEVKKAPKKGYSIKLTHRDERGATTQQPVQKATTKVKKQDEDQVTEQSFKKELKVTSKRKKIPSASSETSPTLMVTEKQKTSCLISAENISKDDAVSSDLKPAEVKKRQDTKRLRSTPTKKKVESSTGNVQSTAVAAKPQRPETAQITHPSQAESLSVKSTPVKVIKHKSAENQRKHSEEPSAGFESAIKGDGDGFTGAETTTGGVEGKTSEKKKLLQKKKGPKTKRRDKTKRAKEEGGADVDSERISEAKPRIKTTKASSLLSSHHKEASEISSGAASSQSPERDKGLSDGGAKSSQSSDRAAAETPAPDRKEAEDLHDRKQTWGEILSDAASLLPAAGMAGAAIGLLGEAVTHVEAFRVDADSAASTEAKTSLKANQVTKQSVMTHPSFSSTILHSDSEERDESTQRDAQMSIFSDLGNAAYEEESNDPSEQDPSEQTGNKGTFENERGGEEDSSEEEDDPKRIETNTGDEEREEELGSDADKDENRESSIGMSAAEDSEPGEEDQEQDSKSEEEESKGESKESSKSDTTDAESEEEESGKETGEEVSHSEVSEAAEEDEGGSEEQSDEESEGGEGSEVSGDKEEKNSDGSVREHSESEGEEEDRKESDTAVSEKSEEEEQSEEEEEEEESEEPTLSDEEQETGKEESGGDDYVDEDNEEEEEEEEEEGELSANDEEAEQEAAEDEEEGEGEGESAEEENEGEEQVGTGNEEDEATEDESKSEEEEKSIKGDEENEEGTEESSSASEEEESEDDDDEEDGGSEEKGKESEGEEEVEEEEEEEDGMQEGVQDEEQEGEEEDNQDGEQTEDDEEEEGEEEAEEEQNGDEEQTDDEEEEEEEEEEEGKDEEEEEEDEEEGKDDEEEEEEEEGEEEDEGDEEDGEEAEEEEAQKAGEKKEKKRETSTRTKGEGPSSLAAPGSSSGKWREAPRPAPRSKQSTAEQKKPEEPQQFWNDVLPQYLDLQ